MGLVETEKLPDGIAGERVSYLRKTKDSRHHQQHDQAAVGVDGNVALLLLLYFHNHFAHGKSSPRIVPALRLHQEADQPFR